MTKDMKSKLIDSRLDGLMGDEKKTSGGSYGGGYSRYSDYDDPLRIPSYLDRRSPMRDDVYDMGRNTMRFPTERRTQSSYVFGDNEFKSTMERVTPRFDEDSNRLMVAQDRAAIGRAIWGVVLDALSYQRIVVDPVDSPAFKKEFVEMIDALLMGASHQRATTGNAPIIHEDVVDDGKPVVDYYLEGDLWRAQVIDADGVVIGERGGFKELAEAKKWAAEVVVGDETKKAEEGTNGEFG